MRPRRARLEEAREVVERAAASAHPERAWATLAAAGVIPRAWLGDPRRRFVARDGRDPLLAETAPHPSSIEAVLALGGDVTGVLEAESAALDLAANLVPFGAPRCDRVVWWALSHAPPPPDDTRPCVSYALMVAFDQLVRAVDGPDRLLFDHAAAWAELAQARAPSLAPPFTALARIEAAGYATLAYVGASGPARGAVPLVARIDDVSAA